MEGKLEKKAQEEGLFLVAPSAMRWMHARLLSFSAFRLIGSLTGSGGKRWSKAICSYMWIVLDGIAEM